MEEHYKAKKNLPISSEEIHIFPKEICKSLEEIHKSGGQIPISFPEICISLREICISSGKIPNPKPHLAAVFSSLHERTPALGDRKIPLSLPALHKSAKLAPLPAVCSGFCLGSAAHLFHFNAANLFEAHFGSCPIGC